jgi:hypothetical protein
MAVFETKAFGHFRSLDFPDICIGQLPVRKLHFRFQYYYFALTTTVTWICCPEESKTCLSFLGSYKQVILGNTIQRNDDVLTWAVWL